MHVVVKASRERVKGDAVKHNLSSNLSSLFLIFLSAERVWNITEFLEKQSVRNLRHVH